MTFVGGLEEEEAYFSCRRLNSTTFVIVEHDRFGEKPFIYAKICKEIEILILSDTGCGGRSTGKYNTLRVFLEASPVAENDHAPLNPCDEKGLPSLSYVIISTHCHYDHILGMPEFHDSGTVIIASALGRSFVESDLPSHSLCKYLDIKTPDYTVSRWAADFEWIVEGRVQILQTPGHTPDELAWYDKEERHLYVGDSFYDRVSEDGSYTQAIIFPPHGDLISYITSLDKLQHFVKGENERSIQSNIKVGCGHTTTSVDAASTISQVRRFFWEVLEAKIPIKESSEVHGVIFDLMEACGSPRFSMYVPRFLVERAREHFHHGSNQELI